MDYENELQVLEILRYTFSEVYRATKILGKEHPEYKTLDSLETSINNAICGFHKYMTSYEGAEEQKEGSLLLT